MVGKFIYLTVSSLDVAYVVSIVSISCKHLNMLTYIHGCN